MVTFRQPTAQEEYDAAKQAYEALGFQSPRTGIAGMSGLSGEADWLKKKKAAASAKNAAWSKLQSEKQAAAATDPNNPAVKAEASWQEAMKLLQKQGPYTPEVVNQLTNRRADQSAAAEAVNADAIRNEAAARGLDPTQALRQGQQQRQAQNIAFSGDIASQAAVQNYAAETPGRMAAAQANLGRTFTGGTTPAVTGGTAFSQNPPIRSSAPVANVHQQAANLPFSGNTARGGQGSLSAGGSNPAAQAPKPLSVEARNKLQQAWVASGGKGIGNPYASGPGTGYVTNGKQTINTRPVTPTGAANFQMTPTQTSNLQASLNSPSTKVYKPGAFGVPKQNLQTFGY